MSPPDSAVEPSRTRERGRIDPGCLGLLAILALGVFGVLGLGCFGMHLVATQVGEDLADNAVIREHLGAIRAIELNLGESLAIPTEDVFVFEIEGSKARGKIEALVVTRSSDREEVLEGVLTLEDGRSYPLFPDAFPPDTAEDPDQPTPVLTED